MNKITIKPRPPAGQIAIYAIGQMGWSLAAYGAANLLTYFYMPPEETGEAGIFPPFIFQGAVLGILTIIGLINFGSRLFDGITDPLIAGWSDRRMSRFGKRKSLMGLAAIPFAIFSFLLFLPISQAFFTNGIWLTLCAFLFYFFMTLYVIPYTALISELGHHPDDRMKISTYISVAWAAGFIIGGMAYAIQGHLEATMPAIQAFQTTMALFSVIALVLMLVPVFLLKENKYALQKATTIPAFSSAKKVFSNQNFKWFTFADLMYWLALTFIQLGVSYYVTTLFGMEKGKATEFLTIGFLVSFLFYPIVNYWAKIGGKKRVIHMAFLVFILVFGLTIFVDKLGASYPLFIIIAVLSGFPLAAFGIIPNAIIADIVNIHEQRTGEQLSGMFYAARNFMMKMGISLANLIFPSLLLLGKSVENPLGVRASAMSAIIFLALGFLFFQKYKEN